MYRLRQYIGLIQCIGLGQWLKQSIGLGQYIVAMSKVRAVY